MDWVLPLALYLITFIFAFDHPRWYLRTPLLVALGVLTPWMAAIGMSSSSLLVVLNSMRMLADDRGRHFGPEPAPARQTAGA